MFAITGEGEVDEEVLRAAMMAAAGSCLVCLSSIKRTDAVSPTHTHWNSP